MTLLSTCAMSFQRGYLILQLRYFLFSLPNHSSQPIASCRRNHQYLLIHHTVQSRLYMHGLRRLGVSAMPPAWPRDHGKDGGLEGLPSVRDMDMNMGCCDWEAFHKPVGLSSVQTCWLFCLVVEMAFRQVPAELGQSATVRFRAGSIALAFSPDTRHINLLDWPS